MKSKDVLHFIITLPNPFLLNYSPHTEPPVHTNPCVPSPCGPYSQCRDVNEHAVCSCLANYIGTPPTCRPECTSSSDCALDKACSNERCVDPCPGTCGLNTRCQVTNHKPICSCLIDFTGDPFVRCIRIESTFERRRPRRPIPLTSDHTLYVVFSILYTILLVFVRIFDYFFMVYFKFGL